MKTLPFGTWPSPITPDAIVAETIRLASVTLDAGRLGWLEGRPGEGGRNVLVRTNDAGGSDDVTPAPFNVRSRVHEYGGGAYAVSRGRIWFSNFEDGRIYAQTGTAAPAPLTAEGPARFADLTVDPVRRRLLAVRETHRYGAPPANDLVSISIDDGSVQVLASGHDFFAAPAPGPDGRQLAWLAWDQPDMPWDAAALWLAELDRDGVPEAPVRIAGGRGSAAFQPAWSPDGALWCVVDPQGWWNLHRWRDGELRCMHRAESEFGKPLWQLGTTTFGFDASGAVVCTWRSDGAWRVGRLDPNGAMTEIPSAWTSIDSLVVDGSTAAFIGGAPDRSASVVTLDLDSGTTRAHRTSSALSIDDRILSRPVALTWATGNADEVSHGYYYPPRNASFRALAGESPPLLVMSHGGPTGATGDTLNPRHPVLDEPRLRGARRRLPRQHRIRPRVSRAALRRVGRGRRRGLRRRARCISPRPDVPIGSVWRFGAAAPAATPRWPRSRFTTSSGPARATTASATSKCSRRTHTSSRRAISIGSSATGRRTGTSTAHARRCTTPRASDARSSSSRGSTTGWFRRIRPN